MTISYVQGIIYDQIYDSKCTTSILLVNFFLGFGNPCSGFSFKCVHRFPLFRQSLFLLLLSILLFKGLSLFGFLIFQFKNALTPLCLSRDKIKGHSSKNATLTPTKTLPTKQDYSPVIFQITLSTYKLDSFLKKKNTYKLYSQNKNTFFFTKNKASLHSRSAYNEASKTKPCSIKLPTTQNK